MKVNSTLCDCKVIYQNNGYKVVVDFYSFSLDFPVSSTPSDVNCYLTSNALHLVYQLIFLSLFSEFKLYYLIFFSLLKILQMLIP